ncbi:hypothetical protein [Cupriavidus plantarum]|uniref:Major facilitator superfamily (MFS) profile domain-containing protein n=1 Tax=Cupriavidus plantarum TaxID=942865 RepID=A0A316F1D6_9BURK|nr:hypothetical protein [Cupriavidus plantarum]PWK37313.1 hypothetical protein C7419_1011195 [Cupriavidus plantarum]
MFRTLTSDGVWAAIVGMGGKVRGIRWASACFDELAFGRNLSSTEMHCVVIKQQLSAGFLVFNSITAFSSNYWLTLAARCFAGVSAGLAWSLLAGYARRMVPVHRQGLVALLTIALVITGTVQTHGFQAGSRHAHSVGH